MNPEEYVNLEQVELKHWFYAGKRRIVLYWLRRYGMLESNRLLIDCGAGTGRFAAEAARYCSVIAVDDHEESLRIARARLGTDAVKRGSCTALPFADAVADSVTALDVLEHVQNDCDGLREMARVLRPRGILVLTVPAFQALWSDWDVALHHVRRYRRSQLIERLGEAGFEVLHCNYINVLACPAVYAVRKWRSIWKPGRAHESRIEDRVPPSWLNKLLMAAFILPASQSLLSFPFGVGILAIARRSLSSGRNDL